MTGIRRIGACLEKSGDSYDVPQGVRNAAKRGLELRRKVPKSKKAGLDTRQAAAQGIGSGVARARDLVSGRVSKESIKRMHRYFSRHAKNYKLDPGKKPEDDKGYQAGLLWGGEAGARWAAKMVERFKREEMRKAKTFPIGTVRTHGGVKKKKTAQGWVPVEADKPKKGAAEEALSAIESKGHANPFNPKEIIFYFSQDGKLYVKMDASVIRGKIHLSEITVSPDGRGKGLGSKILKRITDEADKSGVAVSLIPKPIGNDGLNTKQLKDWYGRHGFEMKQGLMVREPQKKRAPIKLSGFKREVKMDKSFAALVEKGRAHAFPIGTKRKHGKVMKVKTARGWVPVEREKKGETRIGAIQIPESQVKSTVKKLLGGLKEKKVTFGSGNKIRKYDYPKDVSSADLPGEQYQVGGMGLMGTLVGVTSVSPKAKGGAKGKSPLVRLYFTDKGPQPGGRVGNWNRKAGAKGMIAGYHSEEGGVKIFMSPEMLQSSPLVVESALADLLTHELTHAVDKTSRGGDQGRMSREEYVNEPQEINARLSQTYADLTSDANIESQLEDFEEYKRGEIPKKFLDSPARFLGESRAWRQDREYISEKNKRRFYKLAAEVLTGIREGKITKTRKSFSKATKVPKKYLSGLSSSAKKERKAEIRRRAKQKDTAGYQDLPGDKGAKTKPSKYSRTQLAARVRKETKNNTDDEFLRAVAKFTGISKRILRQVHKRGAAAWASGHRPGATQVAWSRARVYSFATGGKTRRTADKDLWAKHSASKKSLNQYLDLQKAEKKCPVAAGNLKLNTKNRNAAIKASHIKYGPLNVDEPGDYWEKIADHWDTTVAAAKKSLCGNCVAFDISPRMDDCMPGATSDDDGRLGYCWMHHFKCHSARSCFTWAKGGPIKSNKVSHDWQERNEDAVKKSMDDQEILKALWLTLEFYKARPTKYIRRVPKPGGGYRYFYRESSIGRAARAGETVRLGDRTITIKLIDNVGRMMVSDGDRQFVFTPDQWRETLNDYYGATYERAAEKRARQAINAVMRLVPSKTLEGLEGTDLQRLEQLKKKSPELFAKLEKSFSRAGMTAYEAKMFINQTLYLKGWEMEARSTLVGSVLSSKGSFAAKNYRRIIAASENLSDGENVRAGHVQSAVDSLYSVFERNIISRKLKKAGDDVTGVLRRVLEAQKKGPISPADAQDLLKGLLGSEALQSISVTAKAVPGFQKNPQVQKIDAGLKKAVMAVMPKGVGNDTKVFVAGEGGKPIALKGKYKLVSAKEAIPSHDPQSFSQNSKYPKGLQERAYHRDKSEQNKVIRNSQRMNPEFVINTNPDALNGPPIVTKEGIVLGGNSRTMSMQRIYTEGGAKAKELKDYLRSNAAQMGFTKEDVDAIEDPIIVREISTAGQDEKLLVRQMNEGFIQALDPRTMQVALGRRLDDQAMESLGAAMTDDDNLRGFLDSNRAKPFIGALNRSGIIDERNRNQYVNQKTGKLNEDGKTLVERILMGRVVNDPDLLSNTMPSMVGAIARAVPYMVQAESHGAGYGLRDDLRYALQAFNRMNDLGISPGRSKGKELDAKIRQIKAHFDDLFEGRHPVLTNPRAEAIFDNFLKRGGPRQIASTFKEYAKLAAKNPEGQATMFGSLSPLDVFNQSVSLSKKKDTQNGG